MRSHPYVGLGRAAFWKTAVGETPWQQIGGLAHAKSRLGVQDRIATAGSCFAQHISCHLRERRFNFMDVEPAPELLRPEHRKRFGYELYSARYGNIYTTAQLRQLVERAIGQFTPVELVWRDNERFYDPFRPSVEPNGFVSEVEALNAQTSHLFAVHKLFSKADVFIFTLGLTECWRSKQDGAVYPSCPGTQAGTFDPHRHEFVNLTVAEVISDLRGAVELLRIINPALRVILTVSPVPLVATASGKHVLTASTQSKAVLRAAAGQLADELPHVDYFPSYEMITAPCFGGAFFSDDKRSVTEEGVAFVMEAFFRDMCNAAPGEAAQHDAPTSREERRAMKKARREQAGRPAQDIKGQRRQKFLEQVLCDEKFLEWFAR